MCRRFERLDCSMLAEFIKMRQEVPEIFYNALLKENISMADILRISAAINELQLQ